ncbi:phage holin, partial [Enterococcus sp. S181_ASV_20]|nr:phage holin [Enterococcus sp. S181_ASV_20]
MQNKTFEILKWVAAIVIPALATFVGVVGKAVNWEYTDITVII